MQEVLETPCLRLPNLVSRRRVLLEDALPSTRHLVQSWLDNRPEGIDVGSSVAKNFVIGGGGQTTGTSVDSQTLRKKEALCVLRYVVPFAVGSTLVGLPIGGHFLFICGCLVFFPDVIAI